MKKSKSFLGVDDHLDLLKVGQLSAVSSHTPAVSTGSPGASAMGPGSGLGGGGASGSGNGSGGGKPDHAGTKKGDLYGDQYVLLRDVDPTDGGGNGEPVLDVNGQQILVGTDGSLIHYVYDAATGDYIIPADKLSVVQTVELGRANVARAPDKVMEKSLNEALSKVMSAEEVTADAAGRLMCDGVTIDSPLENLALYQYLMTAGGELAWPAVRDAWPEPLAALEGWDPSSLLGAAFDKTMPISMDAVLYQNTTLGVNVSNTQGTRYFDFTGQNNESYSHSREDRWADVYIQWYEDIDADGDLELVEPTSVFEAVFGGQEWTDQYLTADGTMASAERSGVNDFAQAVEDARAVINFMHEHPGAIEVSAPVSILAAGIALDPVLLASGESQHEMDIVDGTNQSDWIITQGGPQIIDAGNGKDHVYSGGGPDVLMGGNGADHLDGEGGPDEIDGGNGPDLLSGGAGPDVLTGGHGADVFFFEDHEDHTDGHGGGHGDDHGMEHEVGPYSFAKVFADQSSDHGAADTITDFEPGEDKIDLSGLSTELHWSDMPEAFGIWVTQHGDDTIVHADTNGMVSGSQAAEFTVVLIGIQAHEMSAGDFIV